MTIFNPAELTWRWQARAGRWVLVTTGHVEHVILAGKDFARIQTTDPDTMEYRGIVPSDQVAKIIAVAPDLRRHVQTFINGIDLKLLRIEADGDRELVNDTLTALRLAVRRSGAA